MYYQLLNELDLEKKFYIDRIVDAFNKPSLQQVELSLTEHSESNVLVTLDMITKLFYVLANLPSLEKFRVYLFTFKEDKTQDKVN